MIWCYSFTILLSMFAYELNKIFLLNKTWVLTTDWEKELLN